MKKLISVLVVLAVAGAAVIFGYAGIYNRIVSLDETVTGEWSQVEVQLQRRSDLIPNLVETAKGYAAHERDVFTSVAEARAKLAGAGNVPEKIEAGRQLESALARLLMVVERYPELKADANFIRLQDELAGTENRLAVSRKRYNDAVQTYNITIKRIPANFVASLSGFQKKDAYFKAEEQARTAPKVSF